MAKRGSRWEKVKRIFQQFDMNKDGSLNREEMSRLVIAKNPKGKFTDEAINKILDDVFETYGDKLNGDKVLSCDGLLRYYNDGAEYVDPDVHRDFDALGLELDHVSVTVSMMTTDKASSSSIVKADHIIDMPLKLEKPSLLKAAEGGETRKALDLINRMTNEELEDRDDIGWTALHYAATSGSVKIVEELLTRNSKLLEILDNCKRTPLEATIYIPSHRTKEIVELLCNAHRKNPEFFTSLLAGRKIIPGLVDAGYYDIVLSVLSEEGGYVVNRRALKKMSERPFAFRRGSRLSFWQYLTYSANHKSMHREVAAFVEAMLDFPECEEHLVNSDVLKAATIFGTDELVEMCFRKFRNLRDSNVNGKEWLLHIAIKERNEKIFKMIRDNNRRWILERMFNCGDNKTSLHLVAELAPSRQLNLISGAALQMQSEMQWFKAVENIFPEKDRLKVRTKDGKTAQSIFIEKHQPLMEKAEKWMKDTSQSCMLVAALISTVAFAAAFTVPGGNISDINSNNNGTPIFLQKNSFMLFAIADALALFSSLTSVLVFLAILTSRFAGNDFLESLPRKLIIGLATLFFSIATLMVAFGAALSIVLGDRFKRGVGVLIVIFAIVPVALFAFLQLPLFVKMVSSTYWPSIFRKSRIKI